VSTQVFIQPGSNFDPVLRAMRKARQTIDVVIFRLDETDIEDELRRSVERGLRVRALVAHAARGDTEHLRETEQRLLAAGVSVSRTADDFVRYHGKYVITDETLHILGFNFIRRDIKARSLAIQTKNRRAVKDARWLFECDSARQPFTAGPASPLVVSPETSRVALARFISGARSSLAIYDTRLTDDDFAAIILQRAVAGVDLRVIGQSPVLEGHVPTRALKRMKLHVRAIVRDGTHVFLGSQSLRPLELDRRREVGIVLRHPRIARQVLDIFDDDWERSSTRKLEERDEDLAQVLAG
jgi:phosphatidylserine/phosphatidylglycerophosphate/cardiolipin synthase-like enzyme